MTLWFTAGWRDIKGFAVFPEPGFQGSSACWVESLQMCPDWDVVNEVVCLCMTALQPICSFVPLASQAQRNLPLLLVLFQSLFPPSTLAQYVISLPFPLYLPPYPVFLCLLASDFSQFIHENSKKKLSQTPGLSNQHCLLQLARGYVFI